MGRPKHKLILDPEVINEGTEQKQLSQMARRAKEVLGVKEVEVLADKGYFATDQIKGCVADGVIPSIPEGQGPPSRMKNPPRPPFPESK